MGQKLHVDQDDPFLQSVFARPHGISGGCYCCSRQLHLDYDSLGVLPTAKINGETYNVLVCDSCEEDSIKLEKSGVKNVSYDTLFEIQDNFYEKLYKFDLKFGEASDVERFSILRDTYVKHVNKVKKLKG